MKRDPAFEQEALRQASIVYAALIGTGVLFVQPFLSARSLDAASMTSVVAFAVAIPLLAGLVIVNRQEIFRGRRAGGILVSMARSVGQSAAFVGVAAGFWHIHWVAGVVMVAAGLAAVAVLSAGFGRLEGLRGPRPDGSE